MAIRYIKESFSDNLPSWLTKAIKSDNTIKDRLNRANIDLVNAVYVPDVLKSNRDPKLKDPSHINIFKLPTGYSNGNITYTAYLVGVNNPPVYIDGEYQDANKLSWKKLIDEADEYGYIEINDPDLIQKKADRKTAKAGSIERGVGQYHKQDKIWDFQTSKYILGDWRWLQARGQDKSGYSLNPTKYIDMLDDVNLNNYADRLQSYYDKIEACREQIVKLISNFTIDTGMKRTQNRWRPLYAENISDCIKLFSSVINDYKRLTNSIKEIIDNSDLDDIDKNRAIKINFKNYSYFLRDRISKLKDQIDETINAKFIDDEE